MLSNNGTELKCIVLIIIIIDTVTRLYTYIQILLYVLNRLDKTSKNYIIMFVTGDLNNISYIISVKADPLLLCRHQEEEEL
jgi:hypothetical protein